jgi:hypothetical protein
MLLSAQRSSGAHDRGADGVSLRRDISGSRKPETDGRWHSAALPIAIGLEGTLATVYTADGRCMLHEGEVEVELERLHRLLRVRQSNE